MHRPSVVLPTLLLATAFVASGDGRRQPFSAQEDCPIISAPLKVAPIAPCGTFKTCGIERWPVKILTDRDADRVDFNVRRATVTQLGKLLVPDKRRDDRRASVEERRVYCVDAWVVGDPRPQGDGDIHVVLAGIEDTTSRMIVEFPDIRCPTVCASRFAPAIANARNAMEDRLKTFKTDRLRVRIVGVGFFDRNHNQSGAAPNFFELHPVLAVSFP